MRRVPQWLVRLYPADWRARYGEEFETLIEDSSPGWRTVFDLLKGAIRMQLQVPSFPKLAGVLSLAGAVGGLRMAMVVPRFYVSTAKMQLAYASSPGPDAGLLDRLMQVRESALSDTNLSMIIQDPRLDLYQRRIPLGEATERMRQRDIRMTVDGSGSDRVTFQISFISPIQAKALHALEAVTTKFVDVNQQIAATAQAGRSDINLKVIAAPNTPAKPMYPDPVVFMVLGFGAGFALAVVIAALRRRRPQLLFPAQSA